MHLILHRTAVLQVLDAMCSDCTEIDDWPLHHDDIEPNLDGYGATPMSPPSPAQQPVS